MSQSNLLTLKHCNLVKLEKAPDSENDPVNKCLPWLAAQIQKLPVILHLSQV